jgi:cytoskeletal protein RodZ
MRVLFALCKLLISLISFQELSRPCLQGWAAGEDGFYCMAKGTFGERLKRERELREVTLEEVSTATRISVRFLEALENEDWTKLPGGVFGHGFVRSIARYLGLSEESLLAEYDLARGENLIAPPPKPEERIPSPPKWIPVFAVLVILLLLLGLVFAGLYAWKKYKAHKQARQSGRIELLVRLTCDG